ncbi:NAD-dependent epimerase/dehydratase family protein [Streptosporangium sandarakinum]
MPEGAEFVQADLRDPAAVNDDAAGCSVVVHLAGVTQEGPFAEMVEHNITGTHHVLEAARRQEVPRVVLASSRHVTGLTPIGAPAAPLVPDSLLCRQQGRRRSAEIPVRPRDRHAGRRRPHRQLPLSTQRTPPPGDLA